MEREHTPSSQSDEPKQGDDSIAQQDQDNNDNQYIRRSEQKRHQPTYLTDYECQITSQSIIKLGTPYPICNYAFYANLSLSQKEFSLSILNETKPMNYEEASKHPY